MGRPKGSGNMELYKHGIKNLSPHPNPNIGEISKTHSTGPKTVEGKVRSALLSGFLQNGANSKLLNLMTSCQTCPLKPKETEVYDKKSGQMMPYTLPAKCQHFMSPATEVDGKPGMKCVYPAEEQILKLKAHFVTLYKKDITEVIKERMGQALVDAEMSRKAEIMETGQPRFFTNLHEERGMKAMVEIAKMQSVQKHAVAVATGDLAKEIMERISTRQQNTVFEDDLLEDEELVQGEQEEQPNDKKSGDNDDATTKAKSETDN